MNVSLRPIVKEPNSYFTDPLHSVDKCQTASVKSGNME